MVSVVNTLATVPNDNSVQENMARLQRALNSCGVHDPEKSNALSNSALLDAVQAAHNFLSSLDNSSALAKALQTEVDGPSSPSLFDNSTSEQAASCLSTMCAHMGVPIESHISLMSDIPQDRLATLRNNTSCKVGYTMYTANDPRNHVVPVKTCKSATVDFTFDGNHRENDCVHGITSTQEFFNPGGRFYKVRFFSNLMQGSGFGADSSGLGKKSDTQYPPVPESVDGSDVEHGGSNITRGVVRPKKRVIKSVSTYDKNSAKLRNYAVAGTTMFNNVDEMYLNVVSREYAQEILEHLFQDWGLPTEEPETMRFAEDLVFAFIVARTASNKADYNAVYDIPTKTGTVEGDFSQFSVLLADHYDITRRNFSRSIADDIREYLRRPENAATKNKAASRIGADPQYGHLCFDGSTNCSGMTTSEQKFTKVLEARNLYENEALLADGASSTLMEGIHGGTRSLVAR